MLCPNRTTSIDQRVKAHRPAKNGTTTQDARACRLLGLPFLRSDPIAMRRGCPCSGSNDLSSRAPWRSSLWSSHFLLTLGRGHASARCGDPADRLRERRLDPRRHRGTKTLIHDHPERPEPNRRSIFATADDTAKAPVDFVADSGSVRFAGKKLTRTVAVTIFTDALDEPDEAFFLELTGATGATIADGEGVGTILDDDPTAHRPSTIDALCPRGQTGDTTVASIDVTLRHRAGRRSRLPGPPRTAPPRPAGHDYVGGSGTLDFAPGETDKAILITVTGDLTNERTRHSR